MKKINFPIIAVVIFTAFSLSAEEIRLSTIVPSQTILRAKKGAIGDTWSSTATLPNNSIPASSFVVEGNVGIRTTTPNAPLTVTASTADIDTNYALNIYTPENNTKKGAKLEFGFGTNPYHLIGAAIGSEVESGTGKNLIFYTTNGNLSPGNEIERMRIAGNGYVGINTSSPLSPLHVNGGVTIIGSHPDFWSLPTDAGVDALVIDTTSNGARYFLRNNGTHIFSNAVTGFSWTSWSDIRFKKNIEKISGVSEKIEKIDAVKFDWNIEKFPKKGFPKGRQIGLIAQDVEKEFPELVTTDSEGYKSVSYEKLTAVLLEAIKEQRKEIDMLKKELAEIKSAS